LARNEHPADIETPLVAAQAAFAASQFDRVVELLIPHLETTPTDLPARSMVTNAFIAQEDYESALEHLEVALKQAPDTRQLQRAAGLVLNRLGSAALKRRDFPAAREYLERALRVHSDQVDARFNLGICLSRLDEPKKALAAFRKLPKPEQGKADTLYYVAVCEQALGDAGAAFETAKRTARAKTADADLLLLVAKLLSELDAYDEVLRVCDRVESLGGDPEEIGAHRARINLLLGDLDEAERTLKKLSETKPDSPRIQRRLIDTQVTLGRLEQATDIASRGDAGELGFTAVARALWGMPPVPESTAHIEHLRSLAASGLARLEQERPVPAHSLDELGWSNFYLSYQGRDNKLLKTIWGEIVNKEVAALRPDLLDPGKGWETLNDTPRIGFLSSRWANTVIGNYFGPWIGALTKAGFETYLYVVPRAIDAMTHELEKQASVTRLLHGSTESSAATIRRDCLDLLIIPEVGAENRITALAALRLAKKQAAAWGLPDTTGLATVDCFFTQDETEPDDGGKYYSEQLIRLPNLGISYPHPPKPSNKTRADFGLPADKRLYLFPHSAFKVHPDSDDLVARILAEDDDGLLVCFESEKPLYLKLLSSRMEQRFNEYGLDYSKRVVTRSQMAREDYLALNACCDVMVDNLHFSGGNTTLDALSVGLPVVTLASDMMRGRQSTALLKSVGAEDLVVDDREGLVTRSLEVAQGHPRQQFQAAARALFGNRSALKGLVARISDLLSQ